MVRHAGCGVIGKALIGGANERLKIGICVRAQHRSGAGPDLVPADIVEPAIRVVAAARRQNDRGRQAARCLSRAAENPSCGRMTSAAKNFRSTY